MLLPENAAQTEEYLQQYIARGELGVKTGRGFYTYPDPEFGKDGFLIGNS
jgi:3-hydroxybutyryl-CoA dehydrogenase